MILPRNELAMEMPFAAMGEVVSVIKPTRRTGKYIFFYDIEVYRNLFCVTFKAYDHSTTHRFCIWFSPDGKESINEIRELLQFLNLNVHMLIGYNNKGYDNLLLGHLMLNKELFEKADSRLICSRSYVISAAIIEGGKRKDVRNRRKELTKEEKKREQDLRKLTYPLRKTDWFRSLDVMLMFNPVDRASLKQLAVNIHWYDVRDLPVEPTGWIHKDMLEELFSYNLNDCLILERVLTVYKAEDFQQRIKMTNKYELDLLDSCDVQIAKKLIAKYYCAETGMDIKDFMKGGTFYKHLILGECISPRIRVYSRQAKHLIDVLRKKKIDPNIRKEEDRRKQFEFIYNTKYVSHTIGLGGIHSINPPQIMEESEGVFYYDIDARSFYPYIMINEGMYPQHLGRKFIGVYDKYILKPRIEAKRIKDKVVAAAMKITANGTFGLTKSIGDPLYDPKVTTAICLNGELYFISLMEGIEQLTKAVVVYSNTDGATLRIPAGEFSSVMRILRNWESYTGFTLEMTRIKKIVIRDINNYIMFTYDPEKPIKAVGVFNENKPINKGYTYPIIGHALRRHYDEGIPFEDVIRGCKDIHMFVKATRIDTHKFSMILKRRDGTRVELQKTNRWIVTEDNPDEGKLYKEDNRSKALTAVEKQWFVTVINKLPEHRKIEPEEMNICYQFYIEECFKVIYDIRYRKQETLRKQTVEQLDLFGS